MVRRPAKTLSVQTEVAVGRSDKFPVMPPLSCPEPIFYSRRWFVRDVDWQMPKNVDARRVTEAIALSAAMTLPSFFPDGEFARQCGRAVCQK